MTTPKHLNIAELFDFENKARIEKVRGDITARLRKACDHLSDEEFSALVDKMTQVQVNGEERR